MKSSTKSAKSSTKSPKTSIKSEKPKLKSEKPKPKKKSSKSDSGITITVKKGKPKLTKERKKTEWTELKISKYLEDYEEVPMEDWKKISKKSKVCFYKNDGTFNGGGNLKSIEDDEEGETCIRINNKFLTKGWLVKCSDIKTLFVNESVTDVENEKDKKVINKSIETVASKTGDELNKIRRHMVRFNERIKAIERKLNISYDSAASD